jgi:flagellar hook protein FlgE
MSMMTSFDYGVAAMMAQSEAIGAIGQNIANLRTAGYKRADVQFASLVAEPLPGDRVAGSVVAQTRRLIDAAGSYERTGNPLDIALDGPGMFVYSTTPEPGSDIFYSRNGALRPMPAETSATGIPFLSAYDDLYLMAWPIGTDGKVDGTGPDDLEAIPSTLRDGFLGRPTTRGSLVATVPADGAARTSFDLFHYDSSGLERRIGSDWTRVGNNQWSVSFRDAGGAPLGTPVAVDFDGEGNLLSSSSISAGGLFTLDISGVRQLGTAASKTAFEQDGLGAGDFVNWKVDADGVVSGMFASGAVTPLYQLPLALFANANGLAEGSRGLFSTTLGSGAPRFEAIGKTTALALETREGSNVSLEDAFAQMIVTQRAYASAAQLVQTADEMTRTVRDLR